jgi:hypothetical protein
MVWDQAGRLRAKCDREGFDYSKNDDVMCDLVAKRSGVEFRLKWSKRSSDDDEDGLLMEMEVNGY